MNYHDQFLKTVRGNARFPSDIDAIKAIRAVLEVLGRKITLSQADALAAALPVDFRPYLRQTSLAQPLGLDEFLAQIAAAEDVDAATARLHARAVLSALAAVAPRGELVDTFEQIPKEIRDLFRQLPKAA